MGIVLVLAHQTKVLDTLRSEAFWKETFVGMHVQSRLCNSDKEKYELFSCLYGSVFITTDYRTGTVRLLLVLH